jgi:hypothetical protein
METKPLDKPKQESILQYLIREAKRLAAEKSKNPQPPVKK